jgi:hypothetical protein
MSNEAYEIIYFAFLDNLPQIAAGVAAIALVSTVLSMIVRQFIRKLFAGRQS